MSKNHHRTSNYEITPHKIHFLLFYLFWLGFESFEACSSPSTILFYSPSRNSLIISLFIVFIYIFQINFLFNVKLDHSLVCLSIFVCFFFLILVIPFYYILINYFCIVICDVLRSRDHEYSCLC